MTVNGLKWCLEAVLGRDFQETRRGGRWEEVAYLRHLEPVILSHWSHIPEFFSN